MEEGGDVELGCGKLTVSRVDGRGVSKGPSDSGLGFLEAMSKLLDVADNLFEGGGGRLTLSVDAVKPSL